MINFTASFRNGNVLEGEEGITRPLTCSYDFSTLRTNGSKKQYKNTMQEK